MHVDCREAAAQAASNRSSNEQAGLTDGRLDCSIGIIVAVSPVGSSVINPSDRRCRGWNRC